MRRLLVAAACLGLAALPVRAQQPLPDPVLLDRARAAIAEGRLDEADQILGTARAELVDRNDLDFLRGAAALARNDYEGAIAAFRAILARDPSLNRVRLELARTLFLAGDDDAARHHFQIARAADLPPEVQRNVERFLDQITRRKRWAVEVSLGLAPDTNVNGGTAARTVDLFGIPFTLDDTARKTSGIGVAASLGGSYHVPLDADTRLVMGGRVAGVDYAGGRFDDHTVSAYVGPRFLLGRGAEVTVTATGSRRWYGGDGYQHALGGRVEGEMVLTPRLLLSGSAALQQVEYDQVEALDGPVATAGLGLTIGIDAASLLRLDAAMMRERASEEAFRNIQAFLGLGYYRELPWGFGVHLGAGITFARYDSRLAAFEVTRHDDTVTSRLAVSNRRIDLFGFTPVLAYIHTDRDSNIALYGFSRHRVELSLTRNF